MSSGQYPTPRYSNSNDGYRVGVLVGVGYIVCKVSGYCNMGNTNVVSNISHTGMIDNTYTYQVIHCKGCHLMSNTCIHLIDSPWLMSL